MASARKALLTVHVGNGEETLLIPFNTSRTASELLNEVQRRLGLVDMTCSALRMRSADGPRIFGEDAVEDIITEGSVFHVGPAAPLAASPVHGQSLSPIGASSPLNLSIGEASTVASPQSLLSPPVPPFPCADRSEEGTPVAHPSLHQDEVKPKHTLLVKQILDSSTNRAITGASKNKGKKDVAKTHPSTESLLQRFQERNPFIPKEFKEEEMPLLKKESTEGFPKPKDDDEVWYFMPPTRGPASVTPPAKVLPPRKKNFKGEGDASSKGDDMGGDATCAPTPPIGGVETPGYIETVSDRRADWVITGIRAKLLEYPKGTRMFSPDFATFGLESLGLVLYLNGNSNARPGFCSLGLKAPHGSHLRYKLHVNGIEKFTELRQNVTESWGFVDMCRVEDAIDHSTDSLRLGVEVIDDIDKNEDLLHVSPNKIEWTLKNMTQKLDYYVRDVALYSEEFSAAGCDKLRMKLYLRGKNEADEGWCSLYLEAPKGSELRCRLSVGRKGMSFDRVEKFGEDSIWGFLTLCPLQAEIENDQLVVGMQVLETKRLDASLSETEDAYLKTLTAEKRGFLLEELQRVEKVRDQHSAGGIPSRFRILMMELPDTAKAVCLQKLESLGAEMTGAEATKLKRWVDGVLSLPFGRLERPVVNLSEGCKAVREYLARAEKMLDDAVFGHDEPKERITQVLCQWVSNPDSASLVLGIQGPPGNGKTTLCRKGIAEALSRPFVQISLGGATDASVLEGHSYTYVGSSWGRVAGLLMETQCMNPIIFFDELDKVSETPRGEEINGVLTHLTDHSQNNNFTDRYFDGIPIDLSKAMFIFSFNDESKIHPVLRDRLTIIRTKGFDKSQKLQIADKYLLPDLLTNVGMQRDDISLAPGTQGVADVQHMCERWGCASNELSGVRGVKQALEAIVLHTNKLRVLQGVDNCGEVKEADAGEKTPSKAADSGVREPEPMKAEREGEAKDETEGEAKDANEGEVTPKKGEKYLERKKEEAPLRITLPMTLNRELIDKLLPERNGAEKFPAYMYV